MHACMPVRNSGCMTPSWHVAWHGMAARGAFRPARRCFEAGPSIHPMCKHAACLRARLGLHSGAQLIHPRACVHACMHGGQAVRARPHPAPPGPTRPHLAPPGTLPWRAARPAAAGAPQAVCSGHARRRRVCACGLHRPHHRRVSVSDRLLRCRWPPAAATQAGPPPLPPQLGMPMLMLMMAAMLGWSGSGSEQGGQHRGAGWAGGQARMSGLPQPAADPRAPAWGHGMPGHH